MEETGGCLAKKKKSPAKKSSKKPPKTLEKPSCIHCREQLEESKVYLVEQEVGRLFCSEKCIAEYFKPDSERLESEFFEHVSEEDFVDQERAKFVHLRWPTLESPDEVWRQRVTTGDSYYTLISKYSISGHWVYFISICLFLRGEPSFMFLGFPTKDEALVESYRRGERLEWPLKTSASEEEEARGDTLASEWSAEESMLAELHASRREDDIPSSQFEEFQKAFLEVTLESPDELWSYETKKDGETQKLYHFVKKVAISDKNEEIFYVVVTRETEEDEMLEVLEAFPTKDTELVDAYRIGELEEPSGGEEEGETGAGEGETTGKARVLH